MTTAGSPELSVVVVALGSSASLSAMLGAVTTQHGPSLEVIVPATARVHRLLESVGDVPPTVRIISLGDEDEDTWRLRARGVAAARGTIVATLEDHALPQPGWAARVVEAHAAAPHAAIGGVVEKATPDRAAGWAMYFFDYGRYIPPQVAGPRAYLTACNVSYKRAALAEVADAWRVAMHETTVHFALLARGATLWLDPSMVVRQRRPMSLTEGLDELRTHGALFGRDRAATLSATGRVMRLVATPAVPLVHLARSLAHPIRAPHLLGGYLRAFPTLVAFAAAWALGEAQGLARRRSRRAGA